MKKTSFRYTIISVLFAAICLILIGALAFTAFPSGVAEAAVDFQSVGKSAYLIDDATGTVLYARNENERRPIASMVKIMTSLLIFERLDSGALTLDDDVAISHNAASMGGSQVFLSEGTTHKLGDLLKTVIVASANDSCVALAEHAEGSVENFVGKMNMRAKELGMQNTSFKNCTGLPCAEAFSTAKDVSIMFRSLITHPKYFDYAKIWLEDYEHPDGRKTTITNTNKLVRFYDGCDGGKTGYTNEAKFCLSATAKRDNMRVIAVMMGADSSKNRNAAISAMFDWAFSNFENKVLLKSGENLGETVNVVGGKTGELNLTVQNDLCELVKRGSESEYQLIYDIPSSVKAPVKCGDVVGEVKLIKGGEVVNSQKIVANEDVERRNLFDSIKEIGKRWGI